MPDWHHYLLIYSPPVPGCYVTLSWGNKSKPCPAIIDTGADRTFIPSELIGNLNLRQFHDEAEVEVTGPSIVEETIENLYAVNLRFLGLSFPFHPVVPSPNWPEVLIGRDIINKYILTLDGPNRVFSIEKPQKDIDNA